MKSDFRSQSFKRKFNIIRLSRIWLLNSLQRIEKIVPKRLLNIGIKILGLKFNLELMPIDLLTTPWGTFSESSTPKFEQFLPSWLVERKISLVSITTSIFCKFSEKGKIGSLCSAVNHCASHMYNNFTSLFRGSTPLMLCCFLLWK